MRIQQDTTSLARDLTTRATPGTGAPTRQPQAPSAGQVDAFVDHCLGEPDLHGHPNIYQLVDRLDISPQAKTALEDTMARQDIGLAEAQRGQPLTGSQLHFVYNGNVFKAAIAVADGHGSVQELTHAIAARGERMQDVLSQQVHPGATSTGQTQNIPAQ